MSIEVLLTTYGYPLLFLGTFLEGETVLIIAGFLAHRGYWDLPLVIAIAFCGTFAGDQFFFFLGRTKGVAFLEKRPYWSIRAQRVFDLLHRHPMPVIIGFRFLYGTRNITPFIIGSSRFSIAKFLLLNAIGALIWSFIIGEAGYLFGEIVESVFREVKQYEMLIILTLAIAGLVTWSIHLLASKSKPADRGGAK